MSFGKGSGASVGASDGLRQIVVAHLLVGERDPLQRMLHAAACELFREIACDVFTGRIEIAGIEHDHRPAVGRSSHVFSNLAFVRFAAIATQRQDRKAEIAEPALHLGDQSRLLDCQIDCRVLTLGTITAIVVLSQNLNPDVLVMKPTENWYACDVAELLRASKIRRILVQ